MDGVEGGETERRDWPTPEDEARDFVRVKLRVEHNRFRLAVMVVVAPVGTRAMAVAAGRRHGDGGGVTGLWCRCGSTPH